MSLRRQMLSTPRQRATTKLTLQALFLSLHRQAQDHNMTARCHVQKI